MESQSLTLADLLIGTELYISLVKAIKYLGDYLTYSLENSVHETVVKRAAVAKRAIYEIRTVIEDTRAEMFGAVNLAFDIWETSVLSMVLFNSESWTSMSKKRYGDAVEQACRWKDEAMMKIEMERMEDKKIQQETQNFVLFTRGPS